MLAGIRNFFRKADSISFAQIGVDMHSHILPGLDDGTDTLEMALEMVADLKQKGYRKLIMTPHIMGDFFKNTPDGIQEKLELLRAAVKKNNWNIQLECAAEYYLDEWFLQKIAAPQPLLTFGNKYLLFETSYINEPLHFKEAVFNLKSAGYKPVLAHPERYTYLYGRFEELERIYETGVLFQINLNSLAGYYSETAKQVAEKLVDKKLVHFVGTDAHHTRHLKFLAKTARMPYFKKVLALPLLNYNL